jgi:hypothetical protein
MDKEDEFKLNFDFQRIYYPEDHIQGSDDLIEQ